MMFYPNLRNEILLTGAGFSASAGGYLAYEMWGKLFNHPLLTSKPQVKKLMRDYEYNFDYERIYHEVVIENKFADEDPEAKLATEIAMQEIMSDLMSQTLDIKLYRTHLEVRQLKSLIKYFSGNKHVQGVIFSTNQDLFMEGLCWQGPANKKHMIHLPGLTEYPYGKSEVLIPENNLTLEQLISEQIFSQEPYLSYCKLHGSWAWQHINNKNHIHITGFNKLKVINKEPLLSWYFALFKKALQRPNVKLLVIGYGFNDSHINQVIREAVKNYGLKIYVIDPRSPIQFNRDFVWPKGKGNHERSDHMEIWNGIEAYLSCTLQKMFPPEQPFAMPSSRTKDLSHFFDFMKHFYDTDVSFNF